MSQRIGSWKTNTEHHLIPTGYGNASNKSSPVGMPTLTIRRETQREGLCLASINRQFIQSGIGFHLLYWKFILKQNASAMSIDNHSHVNGSACSRRFSASEMVPFYTNTKIVYLSSNQTSKHRWWIKLLYWNEMPDCHCTNCFYC